MLEFAIIHATHSTPRTSSLKCLHSYFNFLEPSALSFLLMEHPAAALSIRTKNVTHFELESI